MHKGLLLVSVAPDWKHYRLILKNLSGSYGLDGVVVSCGCLAVSFRLATESTRRISRAEAVMKMKEIVFKQKLGGSSCCLHTRAIAVRLLQSHQPSSCRVGWQERELIALLVGYLARQPVSR